MKCIVWIEKRESESPGQHFRLWAWLEDDGVPNYRSLSTDYVASSLTELSENSRPELRLDIETAKRDASLRGLIQFIANRFGIANDLVEVKTPPEWLRPIYDGMPVDSAEMAS